MKEALPKALLDKGVAWHTRKGMRPGCTCNYCLEKRIGTAYIGRTPFPSTRYYALVCAHDEERYLYGTGLPLHFVRYDPVDHELAHEAVKQERERKRNIVRASLKEAKEIIF